MTVMVISDEDITKLKKYAESNRLDVKENDKIRSGDALVPGDRPEYILNIPNGFKLVFTISEYRMVENTQKTLWFRHMSMSLNKPGRIPNLSSVEYVSKLLGFPEIDKCRVTCENNIIEVIVEYNCGN